MKNKKVKFTNVNIFFFKQIKKEKQIFTKAKFLHSIEPRRARWFNLCCRTFWNRYKPL